MNAKLNLPPSGRDWDVYRGVRVEDRTTREVAAEFRISQTRVRQIVERVALFMLQVTPEGAEEERAKRVNLAEQIAAARLQHLLRQATQTYEGSKGEQTTTRVSQDATGATKTVKTTRMNFGEVRYLDLAARLALRSADLPVPTLSQYVVWEEEDEEVAAGGEAREAVAPAEEDCSKAVGEAVVTAIPAAQPDDATIEVGGDCVRAMMDLVRRNEGAAQAVQTTPPAAAGALDGKRKAARRMFLAAAG